MMSLHLNNILIRGVQNIHKLANTPQITRRIVASHPIKSDDMVPNSRL